MSDKVATRDLWAKYGDDWLRALKSMPKDELTQFEQNLVRDLERLLGK
jgi:hypothetical protein